MKFFKLRDQWLNLGQVTYVTKTKEASTREVLTIHLSDGKDFSEHDPNWIGLFMEAIDKYEFDPDEKPTQVAIVMPESKRPGTEPPALVRKG